MTCGCVLTNSRKLVEDLRSQVKHFKALTSAANSEAGSEEEEEWEDEDDEEFAASVD